MKKKNFIILSILLALFLITPILAYAQDEAFNIVPITYKPNVPIPIEIRGANGVLYDFAQENEVSGDFLAAYIVGIYTYAAGFVGIVAMFMLVIAAWRWLFAAGNAQKINAAKDMVTGTLIGLALLFGGQLLLSQISDDFKSVKSLDVSLPPEYLAQIASTSYNLTFCQTGDEDGEEIDSCEEYQDELQCSGDICKVNEDGSFDDRCVPRFDSGGQYDGCTDCPWGVLDNCSCTWYGSTDLSREDPCDCDGDKKWPDPDGCNESGSSGTSGTNSNFDPTQEYN